MNWSGGFLGHHTANKRGLLAAFGGGGVVAALVLGVSVATSVLWHLHSRWFWAPIGLAVVCCSFAAWMHAMRITRAISGTPRSRIASAAQGYVELCGLAQLNDTPLTSPYGFIKCVWYRYEVAEKDGDGKWRTVEHGMSDEPIAIDDDTGSCAIQVAEGFEVVTHRKEVWDGDAPARWMAAQHGDTPRPRISNIGSDRRITEYLLLPSERLYALGDFSTYGGPLTPREREAAIAEELNTLLTDWKRDQPALRARFDTDGNGELSLDEWEQARLAARREAETRVDRRPPPPLRHRLRPSAGGQPSLVAASDEAQLLRRTNRRALGLLLLFFASLALVGWLFLRLI